ncbi:hypothetical protein OESDEN_18992, partial [Oesophagostomum dentatum]
MSEDASLLAVKLNMHDHALSMMIEDLGRHSIAIKYIAKRPPDEVSGPSRSILLATILELRLREYAEGSIVCDAGLEDAKCEELLLPFIEEDNMTEALHLARVFHCFPVVQHILKKTGRTKELLQYYLKNDRIGEVVE